MKKNKKTLIHVVLVVWLMAGYFSFSISGQTSLKTPRRLIKIDLLKAGEIKEAKILRDIFRPAGSAPPVIIDAARNPVLKRADLKAERPVQASPDSFLGEISYIGFIRTDGRLMAIILSFGKTITAGVGEEIFPGYRVFRLTETEIEIERLDGTRKIFSRRGEF